MKPLDRIRVRLLGAVEIVRDDAGSIPIRISTKKVSALIAFLAMSRNQAASREQLATLLWGSCSEQQARQSLRQALVLLRKDLGSPNIVFADKETVRLQPGAWSVDVLDFEQLAEAATLDQLQRAVALYRGEFLAGFVLDEEAFDEWLQVQRERGRQTAGRVLATYAERADAAGQGPPAIASVERLLALDPLREDWQRLALRLYARHRGQHDALAQAKAFEALLQRELDVEPEPETQALVEQIRSGGIARVVPAAEPLVPADAPAPSRAAEVESDGGSEASVRRQEHPRWQLSSNVLHLRSIPAIATAATVAALVLIGGVLAITHSPPGPVAVAERAPQQPTEPALAQRDPWQSPRLPSRPAASHAAVGGLVAIAVLPFSNQGEPGQASDLAAEIITEDLTDVLSRTAVFRVISRQTARSYRGQRVEAVGAELGVRYVLEGGVSKRGDRLSVNVELADARTGLRVWSGRFERAAGDLPAIQDEIVNGLGRELQIEVTRLESHPKSNDPDVHELIFKGSAALMEAAKSGLAALQQAEGYFAQALERDPGNPRAQAGLGAYHVLMAVQLFAPDPAPHLAKAEAILQQVIDRYPNMAGPYAYMGLLDIARRHHDAAARWFERAIELNPSLATSYAQLGRLLVRAGRPDDGLQHILYAMRLSPRDPSLAYWLGFAGFAELELKHYDRAIEYLDRAVALHPTQPRTLLVLIAAHALAGNMDEARSRLKQVQKSLPHLSHDKLIERFIGDHDKSGTSLLREGLRLALASPWESPRSSSRPLSTDSSEKRRDIIPIVVLPFKTYGETAGSIRLMSDMMTDDLINMLSRANNLRVISRQSARSYQNQPIEVIGAELGVRYVLEGSMRMIGDRLRVNVELIDPATRLSVWSGRIERDGADRQAVQDEIIGRLSRELSFELFPIELERRAKDNDTDTLIYRGWAAMNAAYARTTLEAFKQAEALFLQALEREPQNPMAQLGVAAFHANVGAQQLDGESAAHLHKARDLLQDVIRRRPTSAPAHHFMGFVYNWLGDLADAIESFERAVEINPSAAGSHAHLGHALARSGRLAEGLEHLHYAIRLSPRDPNMAYWLEFVGSAELELGRHQQAIESFLRSTTLNPGYPRSWAGLAAAYALAGRIDEAHASAEKLKTMAPSVSADRLVERFGRRPDQSPRLREGLRLALAPTH